MKIFLYDKATSGVRWRRAIRIEIALVPIAITRLIRFLGVYLWVSNGLLIQLDRRVPIKVKTLKVGDLNHLRQEPTGGDR